MGNKRKSDDLEEQRKKKRLAQQTRRRNLEYQEREKVLNRERKKIQRRNEGYCTREKVANRAAFADRMLNPLLHQAHQEINATSHRNRRLDPVVQGLQQAANTSAFADRMLNPLLHQAHQEINATSHKNRRLDPVVKGLQQAANTVAFADRMMNPVLHQAHQEINASSHRNRRLDPGVQGLQQAANTSAFADRMLNPLLHQAHQEINATSHRNRRLDPAVQGLQQAANTVAFADRMMNPVLHQAHQEINTTSHRNRRSNKSWETIKNECLEAICQGPTHTCYSCDRLFFKRSIRKTSKDKLLSKPGTNCTEEFLVQTILEEYYPLPEWQLCTTCHKAISAKTPKVPKLNINHSCLRFPEIDPKVSKLSPLERRLVAPRIPFMKIFALGCDRQFGIRGGIVNVPVNISKMFEAVPINPNQAGVIHLKLKRKNSYRSDYMYERIRPKSIYEAAAVLCQSPLYRNHDPPIELHTNWELRHQDDAIFDADSTDPIVQESLKNIAVEVADNQIPMDVDQMEESSNNATDEDENENYIHIDEETLIDNNNAVAFAPGEGAIPLPVWLDDNCEEFAFPNIFGGNSRNVNPAKKLSYNEIVNSEIRRTDRRAVEPDHLLFVHKKSQLKQLSDSINIQMKKAVQSSITAAQARDTGFINDAIAKDNAFRCLKNITGSPAYWEQQKKNVMAMVRQYGICTFFITLSAAETKWEELLKILMETVHGVKDADVSELTFEQKAELIRKDPVTCALYFDHRFKEVKKTWFNTLEGPFGQYKINHMYHRIEFQHRGSPHVHMLVWLENAPKYDPNNSDNIDEICDFIDSIISTDSQDPEVQEFIAYQGHRCTKTCHKTVRGKTRCRFGAPFPPMRQTTILTPLVEELSVTQKKDLKAFIDKMNETLDSRTVESFDELLEKLECDEATYIRAIRSQLNVNKVFIKRSVHDCRVNPYCKKILTCMQSNMDIQYILDPYACINYIVEYINKPARGISRLLKQCVENLRTGNATMHHQLKCVCNCFYNGCEICAQEAAWCRLRLLMSVCSVVVEFINTGRSDTRHRILKSKYELNKLPPESQDIYQKGMIDRYAERPDSLNDCCLADFIANFQFKGRGRNNSRADDEEEEEIGESNDIQEIDIANENEHIRGRSNAIIINDGELKPRKNPKVIRFCRFDIRKDAVEFFRERIMLFKPWRNEQTDIENINHEEVYNQNKPLIESNSKKYIALDIDIDEVLRQIEDLRNREETENWDNEADPEFVNEYEPTDNVPEPNILFDVGQERSIQIEAKKYNVPDMLTRDDYIKLCNSLNLKQKDYFFHLINKVKTTDTPQYHFITGGAGTGKSTLIKAVHQAIIRILRKDAGQAGKPEVLLVAPTGKAAHNIGGVTAHHAFNIKFGTSEKFTPPSAEKLNTMRTELSELKFVIIDEISMMGTGTLHKVHQTLNLVFKNNNPELIFGGRSVIVFGDFNQLQPVREDFCFMPVVQNPLNIIAGNPLWKKFKMFELTQIMRQREDTAFAEALNRIAIGQSTEEDLILFNQRVYTEKTLPEEGKNAVRLTYTNDEATNYNSIRMAKLLPSASMHAESKAIDILPNNISNSEKTQILKSLENKPASETQGLPKTLILQTGVHYMVSSNIDVSDGLFNGAIGILRYYETHQPTNTVIRAFLEFEDPNIGKQARNEYNQHQQNRNSQVNESWTPIVRSKIPFAVTQKYYNQVMRKQFPLLVAEAITIHKSQGSTFEKVTVQLPKSNIRALIYVALSRATKLENLYMVDVPRGKPPMLKGFRRTNPPDADDRVVLEMNRLNSEALLTPKFTTLREVPHDCLQLISHNVRSLRKNIDTIRSDPVFMNSHIILCQETWLDKYNDDSIVSIPQKTISTKNMLEKEESKGKGTLIYVGDNYRTLIEENFDRTRDYPIDITVIVMNGISIINMYNSKGTSEDQITAALKNIQNYLSTDDVLLCGDFNVNLASSSTESKTFEKLMESYKLKLLSPMIPTTDNGTSIDGVYGRLKHYKIEIDIYESYSSDHKPIVFRLKSKQGPSSGLSQPLQTLNL